METPDEFGRRFARILFQAPAHLVVDDVRHGCEVLDLSLKGALVRIADPATISADRPCMLEFTLDTGEVTIRMDCDIQHVEADHLGLYCREIDLDSVTHLHRLLELNLGDPDELDREFSALRPG